MFYMVTRTQGKFFIFNIIESHPFEFVVILYICTWLDWTSMTFTSTCTLSPLIEEILVSNFCYKIYSLGFPFSHQKKSLRSDCTRVQNLCCVCIMFGRTVRSSIIPMKFNPVVGCVCTTHRVGTNFVWPAFRQLVEIVQNGPYLLFVHRGWTKLEQSMYAFALFASLFFSIFNLQNFYFSMLLVKV